MWRTDVVGGFDDAAIIAEIDDALREVLRDGAERAAQAARSDHVYITRTGVLEGSTQALAVTGSFAAGSLETGIEAWAVYAEPVMRMTGDNFLQRAMDAVLPSIQSAAQDALNRIAARA